MWEWRENNCSIRPSLVQNLAVLSKILFIIAIVPCFDAWKPPRILVWAMGREEMFRKSLNNVSAGSLEKQTNEKASVWISQHR